MKQSVKALPNDGQCFKCLCENFPHLSEAKLKEGVFVGPDIRKMMFDSNFESKMREAWVSFKQVVTKFLRNKKDSHCITVVANMLSKLNCEVLLDERAFEVRWAIAGESIVLQLVAKLESGEYMSFGLSGDDFESIMIGGDVVVAWVDKDSLKGYADDYYLGDKSQCAGYTGSCPDQLLQDGADAVRVLNAALVNGYSIVTYQRTLQPHDRFDRTIYINQSQPIIWAIGPLNQRNQVSYHSKYTKGNHFIDFGRPPKWNCPSPENEGSRAAATPASPRRRTNPQPQLRQRYQEAVQQYHVPETTTSPPRINQRRRGEGRRRIANNDYNRVNQTPALTRQPVNDDVVRANPPVNTRQRQQVQPSPNDVQRVNPIPARSRQAQRRRNGGDIRTGDVRNGNAADVRNGGDIRNGGPIRTTVDVRNGVAVRNGDVRNVGDIRNAGDIRNGGNTRNDEEIINRGDIRNRADIRDVVQDQDPEPPRREPPTPAPVEKVDPWTIPAIQCYEPEDGVFYAQMGPTGGRRGYPAITGHVGWGIAWYINGLLIPEINVVRGKTYTFVVEGGQDENVAAKYHPFYITDDPVGGYAYKTDEERAKVHIFAGAVQLRDGTIRPTGVGRLCHWTYNGDLEPEDYPSFGAYQRNLELKCEQGEPGIVQWTPDKNSPDTVYYQCFTHRYLGWKINVLDACDDLMQGSEFHPSVVLPPKDFKFPKPGDLEGESSYQVAAVMKMPPGSKNKIDKLQNVQYHLVEAVANTTNMSPKDETLTRRTYAFQPHSSSNQLFMGPLSYTDLEKRGLYPKPSMPREPSKPLRDLPKLSIDSSTDKALLLENTTSNMENRHRYKYSHVVKKVITENPPNEETKLKPVYSQQDADRDYKKIVKSKEKPLSSIPVPIKIAERTFLVPEIKTDINPNVVIVQQKPNKILTMYMLQEKPREPIVELSPMQPSTEKLTDLLSDEYYLYPLSEKKQKKKFQRREGLKKTITKYPSRRFEVASFLSTPAPLQNTTVVQFAKNTGFNPKSIIYETGFKPITPSRPLMKEEVPEIKNESEVGVLVVPNSSDAIKEFVNHKFNDSIYNVKPYEVRKKRQKKVAPTEEIEADAAEHVSSFYLPPEGDKSTPVENAKHPSNIDIPPGVFVTYDGKKIPGSTLTVRLDQQHNVLRQKMSKAAELVRAGPQFAPFKGDLPPLDLETISSFASQMQHSSLNRDLETPSITASNTQQAITKLKPVTKSNRNKREAHHTPEHTAEQMAQMAQEHQQHAHSEHELEHVTQNSEHNHEQISQNSEHDHEQIPHSEKNQEQMIQSSSYDNEHQHQNHSERMPKQIIQNEDHNHEHQHHDHSEEVVSNVSDHVEHQHHDHFQYMVEETAKSNNSHEAEHHQNHSGALTLKKDNFIFCVFIAIFVIRSYQLL